MPRKTTRPVKVLKALTGLLLLIACLWPTARADEQAPAIQPAVVTEANRLFAGMVKIDITPDPAQIVFQLNGYGDRGGEPATGVMDPIYTRALVLKNDAGQQLAIVSLDLCYIGAELRAAVLLELAGDGFNTNNLLLTATHDHSGFANYDHRYIARKFFGEFDQKIFDFAVGNIVKAVRQAKAEMQPAQIAQTTFDLTGMNRNRRDPAFDIGTGSGPTGIQPDPLLYRTDDRATLLRIDTIDGKPMGVVLHYAAHPTVLSPKNMQVSADWPGVFCRRIEEKTGATAMFVNGALGDSAPLPDWAESLDQEIRDKDQYGADVADKVLPHLSQVKPLQRTNLAGYAVTRDLSRIVLRPLWKMRLPQFLAKAFYEEPDGIFQTVRIGELVFFAVPGEPTFALGWELETLCPEGSMCRIVAPANGYYGYFVTPAEYDEGTYASDSCFTGRDVHERISAAVARALMNMDQGNL